MSYILQFIQGVKMNVPLSYEFAKISPPPSTLYKEIFRLFKPNIHKIVNFLKMLSCSFTSTKLFYTCPSIFFGCFQIADRVSQSLSISISFFETFKSSSIKRAIFVKVTSISLVLRGCLAILYINANIT